MSRGRHARDGQRREAFGRWARDTWTRLRSALAWYLAVAEWRKLAADVRALNAAFRPATPLIPAPDVMDPAQAPRPVGDPPRWAGAARSGPGQPLVAPGELPEEQPHLPGCDGTCGGLAAHYEHIDDGWCPCCYCAQFTVQPPMTPGAACADDGTGPDAGATPAPAAADAAPPAADAATLPPPVPPRDLPGRGQHLPWVTSQDPPGTPMRGEHPYPAWRGDYRRTEPMRAVSGLTPVSVIRPYYPALEAWRDTPAGWTA